MNRLGRSLSALLDGPAQSALGDWQPLIRAWRKSAAGQALITAIDARVAAGAVVYPAQVFRAFEATPLTRTRVLILGQDPYHRPGQAEGLAFSVPDGQRVPPSLRNIQLELRRDLGIEPSATAGSLLQWTGQGVLLLNSVLTVEEGRPGSHASLGWQRLTDAVCAALRADPAPKVFMLWGAEAQRRAGFAGSVGMADGPHCVLRSNHPSPLAATRPPLPFIGCGHFGAANRFLETAGRGTIDWHMGAPAEA